MFFLLTILEKVPETLISQQDMEMVLIVKVLSNFFFAGMDQYLAVLYPLEYNTKVNRSTSLKLIFSVWAVGFLAAAVASSQLISAGERSPWMACRKSAVESAVDLTFGLQDLGGFSSWLLCGSTAFFLVPVLILTGIYLRIFAAASKSSRGIRRNSSHQLSLLNLHPPPLLEPDTEDDLKFTNQEKKGKD